MIKAYSPTFLFIPVFLITISSCSPEKKGNNKPSPSNLLDNTIIEFAKKHNAVIGWDTLDFQYSIEYDRFFSDSSRLILLDGTFITDVYSERGKYFVTGTTGIYPNIFYTLQCSEELANSISKNSRHSITFVIKKHSLKKLDLTAQARIQHELEDTEDGGTVSVADAKIFVEPSDDFFLTGKIVDALIVED